MTQFTENSPRRWKVLMDMMIKKLSCAEINEFLPLIWDVFCEFEASNYPEAAKYIFRNAIYDEGYLARLTAYGAYKNHVPVGILATREGGSHVALFFVDGKYHRQGIGRKLWDVMLQDNPRKELTVHSSKYAIPVYEKLGFVKTDEIQEEDGITYLPMVYRR